ncbi:MAG: extracellular solute-binding protein [Pseudolabrys sp.]|nr:extracellular solute-binding protein [Pseudolabrys sp.]
MSKPIEIDRRQMLKAGAASAAALACGVPDLALAQEKTLDVIMPPSAIRPETLAEFEKVAGIKVRPAPYVSPVDTMGKLLGSGGRFDMMVTLSDLVRPNIEEAVSRKLLVPLDGAKVTNAKQIASLFKPDIMEVGGKAYSMPVYWGYNPVLYNQKFIKESDPMMDSYAMLFDDRYKGRVAIRDDAHESMHMTALCMGHKRPAQMEPADIKEVTKFLISKKGNLRGMWSKFAEAVQMMASGEVHAMFGWLLMRKTLKQQGVDIASNHPKEGLLWWVHAGFIPAGTTKVEDAEKWINFLISPEFGRTLTETTGVPSTSQAAKDSFSKEQQKELGYDVLDSGKPMVRLEQPKYLERWLEAWSEFKAA